MGFSCALAETARAVAGYLNAGVTAREITSHLRACTRRPIDEYRAEAKVLIARRGTAARALAEM